MDAVRPEEIDVPHDPLDVVEYVLTAENLPFDRTDDGDLAFALAVIPLIWLLWTVFSNAIPPLLGNLQVFTQDMYGISGDVDEARVTEGAEIVGGMKHALIGTLMITVIASIISIPVGLMAAIYLVEYGTNGWFSRSLQSCPPGPTPRAA